MSSKYATMEGSKLGSLMLTSYVVPLITFGLEGGTPTDIKPFGTAFFVGTKGRFLTAAHVIKSADQYAADNGVHLGLMTKGDLGRSKDETITPIKGFTTFPEPADIALGDATLGVVECFKVGGASIVLGSEVATYGYPINSVKTLDGYTHHNLRVLQGNVQRIVEENHLPIGENSVGFELSFLLSQGMSGAPLLNVVGDQVVVCGVCVGSYRSEVLEDSFEEVEEDGTIHRESRLKIDQYGFAQDIGPYLDLRLGGFDGMSIAEISAD